MTPSDLHPILSQVHRNIAAGWSWSLLHPEQVVELCAEYKDALERLARIEAIVNAQLMTACGACYLGEPWREVRELCNVAS